MDINQSPEVPKSNKFSRRDFLKTTGVVFGSLAIPQLPSNPTTNTERQPTPDYYQDWDLGWARYISVSIQQLDRSLTDFENTKDNEGKEITKETVIESWLLFHGLEMMFRND